MFYKHGTGGYRQMFEGVQLKTVVHGQRTLMGKFKLAEGAVIPPHSHPHEQSGMLLAGKLQFKIGGEQFETEAGDSWCIHGDIEHSVVALEASVIVEVFSPVREDYLPKTDK